jgi:hypothetical protein
MHRFAAALIVASLTSSIAEADEIVTSDGRKLVGRIDREDEERLTVLTYKDGPVEVRLSDVKARKAGKTLFD